MQEVTSGTRMATQISNPEVSSSWWVQLGDWRLEKHDCSGAQDAYNKAKLNGEDEVTIQQKLKKLIEICAR